MKLFRLVAFAALLALIMPSSHASYVKILSPVESTITSSQAAIAGSEVDLGLVGPGQQLDIIIDRDTGEASLHNITGHLGVALWDQLTVDNTALPLGWQGIESKLFEQPMKSFVIVSRTAPDGEYTFNLNARNDYEGIDPLPFKAKAVVSRNVLEVRVVGEPVKVESKKTATYQLELNNLASADDVFQVSVTGLPGELDTSQNFVVPHNSKRVFDFTVNAPESGEFPLTFTATSLSSPAITANAKGTLFVGSSLSSDMRAASRGVLLFPSAQTVAYSLLAFIGSLMR